MVWIWQFCFFFLSLERSYNQPKLCPSAEWNPSAVTLANRTTLGAVPYNMFVDNQNTVYVAATNLQRILVWQEDNFTWIRNITGTMSRPNGIFVTFNGDIYVDNGFSFGRVDKWTPSATSAAVAMNHNGTCFGVFVDLYNDIYCSTDTGHVVVRQSLNGSAMVSTMIAGNGSSGFSPRMLFQPRGIFVDLNLTLFVADCGNDRVQRFAFGQLDGSTVVGNGSNGTITLNRPSGIAFDADGYLFIVDGDNHRIVGSGPTGFRCIVGCGGVNGSASNQLAGPRSFAFDSDGNILVLDRSNHRLQKFFLVNNSCGKHQNQTESNETVRRGSRQWNKCDGEQTRLAQSHLL